MFKSLFLILVVTVFLLAGAGCAVKPRIKQAAPAFDIPGVYHQVEKGQTLWRISKMYDVDLEELANINRVQDAAIIEEGQVIFIPNRQQQEAISMPASEDFIWPMKGKVITGFGKTFQNMLNKGINIEPAKDLSVVAARGGKVIFYHDDFSDFGKTIIIDHGDGLFSVYARNSKVFIKAGETIQKGFVIAKAGSAGRSKNTYLHFQIRKGHIPQNPYFYLPR